MRQQAGQRRRLKKVLLICALGVGILLLPVPAWWMVRYYCVERTVRAFQSNPSQAGADKLADLLAERSPTQAQAARILKLLLQPVVVTRSAYAIGQRPMISTLLPYYLHFNTTMTCRVEVLADGQDLLTPQFSTFTYLGTGPHVWTLPAAPDNYGKFSMELRFSYSLAAPPDWLYPMNPVREFLYDLLHRTQPQRRWTASEEKPYQVGFRVPVRIDIVADAEAERVQLLSSPELDGRMREALRPHESFMIFNGWLGVGTLAGCLPATVVFDCFLELPDGTRIRPSRPENGHLTGYAGRSLEIGLAWDGYRTDRSHMHDTKLVFESDPNYAEPTIKSIWNGRLEFPIRFWVPPEPNTGG